MKFLTILLTLVFAFPVVAQEVLENELEQVTKESDTADKVYTHASGRSIRVVGSTTKSESISEGSLGRVVETFTLQSESLCPVVFQAIPDATKKLPVVEGITEWNTMTPIVVDRSGKKWIWWVVLDADNCEVMAGYEDYIGSTLKEFIALPFSLRSKILKTYGTCEVTVEGTTEQTNCTVPVGDARAIDGAEVFFPHNLAGRTDLNYKKYKNGQIEPRYKTEVIKEKQNETTKTK